jgi:serine/threonine-protein kinase
MASVYRAEDQRNGQIIALKLVLAGLQKDPEFIKRFERELEISKSLVHPNIVKVFESGEKDGQLYMAMELVEGDNLDAMVAGGPLPLFQVVRVAGQLVDGLHYAHQRDLVHRDIKPSNIMVNKNGIPKLLDFGLALQQGMNRFTTVGAAMGTPTHMAPEALTTGNSDKKSDQYALGICIYQMLTGKCPFEGPDAMNIAMQHVKTPPPSIIAQREEVPLRLEQIVMRMLKKKPEERYPTLTQLQMEIVSAV